MSRVEEARRGRGLNFGPLSNALCAAAVLVTPALLAPPALAAAVRVAPAPTASAPGPRLHDAAFAARVQASSGAVVRGEVLDAGAGTGLAGATVRLVPADSGSGSGDEVVTDGAGAYVFRGVSPGTYHLVVERLGYRSARVRVRVGSAAEARVSVGLEVEPIALEPLAIRERANAPYDRALEAGVSGTVPAVRLRQQRHLSPDVRSLTHRDLLEAVPLAGADLFRALQRLPGVSTRDDWSAELWTRGGEWDETRVVLDGLPLLSPIHGAGLFSGVNSDAVGAVDLHRGVRPARLGEGGAGVLELATRAGDGAGELDGYGELSVVTAQLALDRRGDRLAWMVAGRRSYLDALTRGVERLLDVTDAYVPFSYGDVIGRADWTLAGGGTLEASGIWERDRLEGDVPDVLQGSRIVWGNAGGRVTLDRPVAGVDARLTLGLMRYGVEADTVPVEPGNEGFGASRVEPLDHRVLHFVARAELGDRGGWTGGLELIRESVEATGTPPSPFVGYDYTAADTLSVDDALVRAAGWIQRRWRVGRADLSAGVRAEAGGPVAGAPAVRLAPRLHARWNVSERTSVAAAVGRSWQYLQSPLDIGLPLGVSSTPTFPSGALWISAGDTVPALRADVVTLGGEAWLDERWLLSVTAFARGSDGVLTPDPRPGEASDRPLWVAGEARARGAEVSVRRLAGRWTGSASYTWGRATMTAAGLEYPAPADRRHVVDATSRVRLARSLHAGLAATVATGAPYTRFVALGGGPGESYDVLGEPGAGRGPSYASVDLSLDWMKAFDAWSLGAYLQLRNVLGRRNVAGYSGSKPSCGGDSFSFEPDGTLVCEPGGRSPTLEDEFLVALPRIPLVGFRVRF